MDAFGQFLARSDLAGWNDSLEVLEARAGRQGAAGALQAAVQALTVSCYVRWLSHVSGNVAVGKSSRAAFDRLAARVAARHRESPSDDSRYGIGIIAAWYGDKHEAERIIGALDRIRQDNILLLVTDDDNAERAARLKEFVFASDGSAFPPLVYFYCEDLLTLGSTNEVIRLIEAGRLAPEEPMTLDLLGKIHEQNTEWHMAEQVYARSSWPVHAYRAAICRCIDRGVSTLSDGLEAVGGESDSLKKYLSSFEGEISQREFARTSAFVNACRWNQFDDWIIHYELAKLSFRLRRHAEAEKHFRAAFDQSPAAYRALVGNMRFANLTWMSKPTLYQDLDLTPETLECGRAAIAHAPEAEPLADTAAWIAVATGEEALVEPRAALEDPRIEGEVEARFGDRPAAIRIWREGLKQRYDPRLMHHWIALAATCRFDRTLLLLVEKILANSKQDFFVLWELGNELLEVYGRLRDYSDTMSRLDQVLKTVASRLEEMSHYKFQNLIRAYEFFIKSGRQDVAESLLGRASRLAESPEEFLELAIARRKVSWFSSREGDQLGSTALRKAERESRDRLERLQIAREYCYYGDLERARSILIEERIFECPQDLTPAEHAEAMKSGICFRGDEAKVVYEAAVRNLASSRQSGLITHYPNRFADRLSGILRLDDLRILRSRLAESPAEASARDEVLAVDRPETPDRDRESPEESEDMSQWQAWRARVGKAEEAGDPEQLSSALAEIHGALDGQDIDTLIALWEWTYERANRNLQKAGQVRPGLDPEATPISKSGTVIDDWRAQELTDLWKQYIHSDDDSERERFLRQIEAFNAREAELLEDWERRMEVERRPFLANARAFGAAARAVASRLLAQDEDAWPVFWKMPAALAEDVQALAVELDAQLLELSAQLGAEGNP
ncbi:MAG: hypothetical protein QNK04_29270 [Myxococcota bacterium]|nr:hypothetical protein [Myxococcota bacterium]